MSSEASAKGIVFIEQEAENRRVKEVLLSIKDRSIARVKDPWMQTVTISTGSGAIVLGSVAGAFGGACGVVVGTTAGALPALFTFGLSLPVGAIAGGGMGLCTGATVGGTTGALCGGAAGHLGYQYRVEIKNNLIYVRVAATHSADRAKVTILDKASNIKTSVKTASLAARDSAACVTLAARTKIGTCLAQAYAKSKATVQDRRVQVSAASAAGGAAVCAPVGGAVGTCSGVVIGGAVGLVPALFTFGLSIPVCAAIGGGIGLCTGVATGGCVGAVGGGSVGFGGYTYRDQIKEKSGEVQKKIMGSAELVKVKAAEKAALARESLHATFSGTGGTAA